MGRFEGWRVLVTGASRGIGAAAVRALLREGAKVALVGRDLEALGSVAAEARVASAADSAAAVSLPADLSDRDARDGVVDRALHALGGLDAMVLAAGVARHTPFEALGEDGLREQLELNLIAPLMMLRRGLAPLREGEGSVVLVGSTLADRPAPATTAYAASKAGLHAVTRQLAGELAPQVRVNAVSPGVVDTAMSRALRLAPGQPTPKGAQYAAQVNAQLEALRQLHPLGRLGTPEEVAEAIVYLLGASWTTGTVLTVDGGLSSR